MIQILGDSSTDRMAKRLHRQGLLVLAMSADTKDCGRHNCPLDRPVVSAL